MREIAREENRGLSEAQIKQKQKLKELEKKETMEGKEKIEFMSRQILSSYSGLTHALNTKEERIFAKPMHERQVAQCCQVSVMCLFILIITLSVSYMNANYLFFNTHEHYERIFREQFDEISDLESFLAW